MNATFDFSNPHLHQHNLRFWAFINESLVKITLRPGQTLEHGRGGKTDEGYYSEWTIWEHSGHGVERSWGYDTRDCDGRHSGGNECFCPFNRLNLGNEPYGVDCAVDSAGKPIRYPDWSELDSLQRDYTAEACGY